MNQRLWLRDKLKLSLQEIFNAIRVLYFGWTIGKECFSEIPHTVRSISRRVSPTSYPELFWKIQHNFKVIPNRFIQIKAYTKVQYQYQYLWYLWYVEQYSFLVSTTYVCVWVMFWELFLWIFEKGLLCFGGKIGFSFLYYVFPNNLSTDFPPHFLPCFIRPRWYNTRTTSALTVHPVSGTYLLHFKSKWNK